MKKLVKVLNIVIIYVLFVESGRNYKNVAIIWFTFIINYILTYISGINNLSYKFIFIFFIINLIIVIYIPYYYDIGLGSNRSSSFYNNIILLIFTILTTFSIKGAIIFLTYFLLSDVFFKRSWVEYN